MRVAQIADTIGKHRNTINKWIKEYSDFFSEQLPNETRTLTDDDLRTIMFINTLVDQGFNRVSITQQLSEKHAKGIALPPVDPRILAELSGTEEMGLTSLPADIETLLEEQELALREKDEIILKLSSDVTRLSGDNESLRGELRVYQAHYNDVVQRNEQLNMTIGQLTERVRSLENITTDEVAQQELQRLKGLLAREGDKASRYKDREQRLHQIIGDLNKRLNGHE